MQEQDENIRLCQFQFQENEIQFWITWKEKNNDKEIHLKDQGNVMKCSG